jgi:DDE family transposase
MIDRLASCFVDRRSQAQVEHAVATLVGQRIFAIALGYGDLNDHETLRRDVHLRSAADLRDHWWAGKASRLLQAPI